MNVKEKLHGLHSQKETEGAFFYSFSISCDVTYKVFMKLKVHNPVFHSVNRY